VALVLGWSKQEAAGEVERTLQLLERVHGVVQERIDSRQR